jgi:hypothetical protein
MGVAWAEPRRAVAVLDDAGDSSRPLARQIVSTVFDPLAGTVIARRRLPIAASEYEVVALGDRVVVITRSRAGDQVWHVVDRTGRLARSIALPRGARPEIYPSWRMRSNRVVVPGSGAELLDVDLDLGTVTRRPRPAAAPVARLLYPPPEEQWLWWLDDDTLLVTGVAAADDVYGQGVQRTGAWTIDVVGWTVRQLPVGGSVAFSGGGHSWFTGSASYRLDRSRDAPTARVGVGLVVLGADGSVAWRAYDGNPNVYAFPRGDGTRLYAAPRTDTPRQGDVFEMATGKRLGRYRLPPPRVSIDVLDDHPTVTAV